MSLKDYGWTSVFAEHFSPYARQGLEAGRVVLAQGQILRLQTAAGEVAAEVSGRLRREGEENPERLPAIGDWVVVETAPGGGTARVRAVLPRRSKLSRKVAGARAREQVVAANLDTVFLVMGLDGDFNLRRIERLLVMAWESGARPVAVLNKADLADDADERRREVEAVAPGVPVLLTSAFDAGVRGVLATYLKPGETAALVGSSGVGKSTLINRLLGRELLATAAVRADDDRGRHTTTHRPLVRLEGGGLLIDNPGIRELQLWAADDGLGRAFDEIDDLAAGCRFRDCRHRDEPGCAVRAAVEDGTLAAERLTNLHALERELHHLELRRDQRARRAEKKKVAAIHKAAKRYKPRFS